MEQWMKRYIVPPDKRGAPGLIPRGEAVTKLLNAFPDYFLFSFVRNPYDRFVSIYRHSVRGVNGAYPRDKWYYSRPLCPDLTIHEYAKLIRAGHWDRLSAFDRYHARPQVSYLPDFNPEYLWGLRLNSSLRCAFIGRFERVHEDWNVLRETLGFPNCPLFHAPSYSDEGRMNNGVKKHYSDYYDERLRLLVEEIYADDLKQFGYSFEDRGTNIPANIQEPLVQDCLKLHQSICAGLRLPYGRDKVIALYVRYKYLLLYYLPTLALLYRMIKSVEVFSKRLRKKITDNPLP